MQEAAAAGTDSRACSQQPLQGQTAEPAASSSSSSKDKQQRQTAGSSSRDRQQRQTAEPAASSSSKDRQQRQIAGSSRRQARVARGEGRAKREAREVICSKFLRESLQKRLRNF